MSHTSLSLSQYLIPSSRYYKYMFYQVNMLLFRLNLLVNEVMTVSTHYYFFFKFNKCKKMLKSEFKNHVCSVRRIHINYKRLQPCICIICSVYKYVYVEMRIVFNLRIVQFSFIVFGLIKINVVPLMYALLQYRIKHI